MLKVSAAIIYNDNGEFLICRRNKSTGCPNLWEFAGGKQEVNETAEQCVIRECMEELSVTIQPEGIFYTTTHTFPDTDIYFSFFKAKIIQGVITPNVHTDIKWVKPNELQDYEFCSADNELIKILEEDN